MDFIYNLNLWEWIFFLFFGITTGIINTLAGSGSVVTLPIFMFICGLNPMVANATNRLGIVAQSLVGVKGFQKKK